MKKIVYIEPKDVNFICDRHHQLFYRMIYNYGWELRYEKYPDVPKDCNKIFIWQGIARHRPDSMENLINLSKDIQLIWYLGDVWHDNSEIEIKYYNLMKRADILLCPIKEYFIKKYPGFNNKFRWFPHFLAPIERFEINQCGIYKKLLVTGGNAEVYKLRNLVRRLLPKEYIYNLSYPGVHQDNHNIVNQRYIKLVNDYYCSLATCSEYKFATGKYFEIPGANTLMIANTCQDVLDLGFIPNEHYIEINEDNAINKIIDILKKESRQILMIQKAHDFVLKYHTIENRLEKIKDLL